jgi:hypothetical protein
MQVISGLADLRAREEQIQIVESWLGEISVDLGDEERIKSRRIKEETDLVRSWCGAMRGGSTKTWLFFDGMRIEQCELRRKIEQKFKEAQLKIQLHNANLQMGMLGLQTVKTEADIAMAALGVFTVGIPAALIGVGYKIITASIKDLGTTGLPRAHFIAVAEANAKDEGRKEVVKQVGEKLKDSAAERFEKYADTIESEAAESVDDIPYPYNTYVGVSTNPLLSPNVARVAAKAVKSAFTLFAVTEAVKDIVESYKELDKVAKETWMTTQPK